MSSVADNLKILREKMQLALERSGRSPGSVKLIAVSKLQPVEKMQEYLQANEQFEQLSYFGENYVQEFEKKRSVLNGVFESHLIGPLQSNKAKKAVQLFDLIQSVHDASIAGAINKQAQNAQKSQRILLQVNVSLDPKKSGFTPDLVQRFVGEQLPTLSYLKCEGLMTITELYQEKAQARKDYKALSVLSSDLFKSKLELSMGMSDDFEVAIEEGATMVRVGTALFGEREKK